MGILLVVLASKFRNFTYHKFTKPSSVEFDHKWLFVAGSVGKDWWRLSYRTKRDCRSGCGDWGRRLHQAFHSAARRRHQVTCLDQLLHYWLELSRRPVGLSLTCLLTVKVKTLFFTHAVLCWWPSVLWCCWLGGKKGIRPVKKLVSGGVLAGAMCRLAYGPADATATRCLLPQ